MGKDKKILITGSNGTIGTRIFEKFLAKGYKVTGFDRKPNCWNPEVDKMTVRGDLLKGKDINKLPTDFDLVVHLAANARVYDLVVSPDLALENLITTYNILKFTRRNRIKNFIFSSSREIYGNREKVVSKEKEVDIHLCESPYAASKIGDEALVYAFSKCYGIDYIILRLSNVYGMYDRSNRFIPLMIKKMQKNQNVDIYGKDKFLDFTYIDDCVTGIIEAIENFPRIKNNTFNIAFGKGEKLTMVAQLIKDYLKSKSIITIKPNRPGEVVRYVADISKAKNLLNYKPDYSIQRGVKLTVNWYKENNIF